jgi:hypothetical protein
MLAVQINEVDGELHSEGVDGLTGDDPQALPWRKPLAAKQAFPALGAFIGDFRTSGKHSLAREVRDA